MGGCDSRKGTEMLLRLDQRRINGLLLAGLLVGCATSPQDHVPAVGHYNFTAQWYVSGFTDPATVVGDLNITSASLEQLVYTLTLHESGGREIVKQDTTSWDDLNGYLFGSGPIGRAGVWVLLPHWKDGDCYGNAFNASQSYGVPMTCHWSGR